MRYSAIGGFPPQQLPFSKKTKEWRRKCVQFGDDHSLMHYHLARKSVRAMNINYDLLHGKVDMSDLKLLVNPFDIDASFIPDQIQHYPVINRKLEVLMGEESKRLFYVGASRAKHDLDIVFVVVDTNIISIISG